MSDSVGTYPMSSYLDFTLAHARNLTTMCILDRVFSHALSTVNKIRTGAEKPPAMIRLKLYGLYKQSMGMECNRIDRERNVTLNGQ
jgi:hypothetical protein